MEIESYKDLKASFTRSGSQKYLNIFYNISKYISEDDVKAYYPKNLFNSKTPEMYILTENEFYVFVFGETDTEVSYYRDYKIEKLKLVHPNDQRKAGGWILEIKLNSGSTFILNTTEDSNSEWLYEYKGYIERVFNFLK